MEDIAPILVVPLLVAVAILGIGWTFSRSRRLLDDWAASNGFRLVSADYCWIRRGPFFWTTSKGQTVYRITAVDGDGNRRTGWARCGSFLLGLWAGRVEVRWDA